MAMWRTISAMVVVQDQRCLAPLPRREISTPPISRSSIEDFPAIRISPWGRYCKLGEDWEG